MHPKITKLLPFLVGFLSFLILFLTQTFPNIWVVLPLFIFWILVLLWAYAGVKKRAQDASKYLVLTIVTAFASFCFLSLLEVPSTRFFLIVFTGIIFIVLTNFFIKERAFSTVSQKTLRRIMTVVLVFDAYAFLAFAFAISLFFNFIPFWLLNLLIGIMFGLVSMFIWHMYYPVHPKYLLNWGVITAIIVIELTWVFHLLPFGFLISAFFISWVWYIINLFTRFHFSEEGIVWRKQILFLVANGLLFVVLLFLSRWV